jgi:AcrR family transcriptional regulator
LASPVKAEYAHWVPSTQPATRNPVSLAPLRPAQVRVLAAALELFSEYGVTGTTLQMIADAIGVSKAAVYHQFKTKHEIIIAAAEIDMARLSAALDAAEAEKGGPRTLEVLLGRLITMAVERRRMVSAVQSDPAMQRFLAEYAPFVEQVERLNRLLVGDDPGAEARVRASMISAAIANGVLHPLVVDLDDETLRFQMSRFVWRFLELGD